MKPVTAFLQFRETDWLCKTADSLRKSKVVESLVIVGKEDPRGTGCCSDTRFLKSASIASTAAVRQMADLTDTEYILVYIKPFPLQLSRFALQRMMQVCSDTEAGMNISDYSRTRKETDSHPVIDYEGSLA